MTISYSMLARNPETAEACRQIMGLPEGLEWTQFDVRFGLDEIGEVTVTFIPTGEQVAALAALATRVASDPCVDEPDPEWRVFDFDPTARWKWEMP